MGYLYRRQQLDGLGESENPEHRGIGQFAWTGRSRDQERPDVVDPRAGASLVTGACTLLPAAGGESPAAEGCSHNALEGSRAGPVWLGP